MHQFRNSMHIVPRFLIPIRYTRNGRIVHLSLPRAISANLCALYLGYYRYFLSEPMGKDEKGYVSLEDTIFPQTRSNNRLKIEGKPSKEEVTAPFDFNSKPFLLYRFIQLPLILPFYTPVTMPSTRSQGQGWVSQIKFYRLHNSGAKYKIDISLDRYSQTLLEKILFGKSLSPKNKNGLESKGIKSLDRILSFELENLNRNFSFFLK